MYNSSLFVGMIITAITAATSLQAQDSITRKTFSIDSVRIDAHKAQVVPKVSFGVKTAVLTGELLEHSADRSLGDLLSYNSSVYIKSMGAGARATSSFRGTGSTHTAVLWNGVPINPALSNSFDFSQIPAFFTDNVTLNYGGGQIKNGLGGLGGTVTLNNTPRWDSPIDSKLFIEYGSWNTVTTAASLGFLAGKRTLLRTRAYYQYSDNDFRYLNKVFKKESFYENRKESEFRTAGVMQEAYFRLNNDRQLSINAWAQYGRRHLPQPVVVSPTVSEREKDFSFKSLVCYDHSRGVHTFQTKAAYVLDLFTYDKTYRGALYHDQTHSFNRSHTFYAAADYGFRADSQWTFNGSLKYSYNRVTAQEFTSGVVDRNVVTAQTGIFWRLTPAVGFSLQAVGEYNDDHIKPSFSAGFSSQLGNSLRMQANVAYNCKFPSLNDLYWNPGGNPKLKNEQGFTYDVTLTWSAPILPRLNATAEIAGYLMNIDNWIMWLPTDNWYWEPRNVHNVLSYGSELKLSLLYSYHDWSVSLTAHGSYSPSINRERNFKDDATYHKQLPYVPRYKANGRLNVVKGDLSATWSYFYTGKRFTTADESYSTTAYGVHNAELRYAIRWRGCRVIPTLRADNLFDTYYESTQYYPMPLRQFSASVTLEF